MAINTDEIIDHILENHEVFMRGTASLSIDGETYRLTSFQKFLTNAYLQEIGSDLISLEDAEKKLAIRRIGERTFDFLKAEKEEFNKIPVDSILSGLEEVEDFMSYRPVMDVSTGETYMFCIRTEMLAEMDYSAWLSLAPKDAKDAKILPCISIYDPTDVKKCYAGKYNPTSKAEVELNVLYINEHIKPEWRN